MVNWPAGIYDTAMPLIVLSWPGAGFVVVSDPSFLSQEQSAAAGSAMHRIAKVLKNLFMGIYCLSLGRT